MAAVTQFIPNFLGGISSQVDTKKQPGQVNDISNGYPDPTFGLLKRNGSQFLGIINQYYTDESDDLKDGYWFSISRDNDERYLGVITKSGDIRIWNTVPINTSGVLAFTEATITNKADPDVISYLTAPLGANGDDIFQTFSYLDQTYIVNKTKVVEMTPKEDYYLRTRATIVLGAIEYDQEYAVWIDSTKCSYITPALGSTTVTGDSILTNLAADITSKVGVDYAVTVFSNSLEIERKDGQTPFTIEAKAGIEGVSLTSYQDEVVSSSRLAAFTKPGRRVKVVNSIDARSSYYAKFVPSGELPGSSGSVNVGEGYWQESRGWDIDIDSDNNPIPVNGKFLAKLASNGFVASTMPFKLFNTDTNEFTISSETWDPRLTGNDTSNPVPSFVDRSITFGLVYNNRLVFLTADTISMSVARNFENFFYASAQTVIASDPVDIETSSPKVSNLFCAVPQAQGLVIFSEYEQYLLYSESGVITPTDSIIRTISQYPVDRTITAEDIGDFIVFSSKTSGYTKALGMQPRGNLESAQITDISQVITGYLPSDLQHLVVNSQESLLAFFTRNSDTMYLYKYYSTGKEQLMQAWFKWELTGAIQTVISIDNYFVVLIRENLHYRVVLLDSIQNLPDLATGEASDTPATTTVRLDHSYIAAFGGTIVYDSDTQKSRIPRPYRPIPGYTPVAVTVAKVDPGPSTDYTNIYVKSSSPSDLTPDVVLPIQISPIGDWYVEGNWEGKEFELMVGYEFTFNVSLPRYFYRQQDRSLDWTSSLTISRMKFDVGFSGNLSFLLSRYGAPEYETTVGVQYANFYAANSTPTLDRSTVTVPIHQKNTNYSLRISSSSPFPVSLNSLTWEGIYSTRYYRRA